MKKLFLFLFLSMLFSQPTHAIVDGLATAQSVMELKTEIENKVQEIQKKIEEVKKTLKQGFDLASSCFKNPMQCDPGQLSSFFGVGAGASILPQAHQEIVFTMPNATNMQNPTAASQESLQGEIETNYIYHKSQGKKNGSKVGDNANVQENRDNINNIISNETALLFAKAATTRHSIQLENDMQLYARDFGSSDGGDDPSAAKDSVLQAEAQVVLLSVSRLARILELRSSMIGTQATAELMQQSVDTQGH